MSSLDRLVEELERTAERLRSGELGDDEGAALVERCAELASAIGTELEREAREVPADAAPGQESLY
jgi:hypothetical protein